MILYDIIDRRYKISPDDLFQICNTNYLNMKFTFEVKPDEFIDQKFIIMT